MASDCYIENEVIAPVHKAIDELRALRTPKQEPVKWFFGSKYLEGNESKPRYIWMLNGGTARGSRSVGSNPATIVEWDSTFDVVIVGRNSGHCRDLRDEIVRGARESAGPYKLRPLSWTEVSAQVRNVIKDGEAWTLVMGWAEPTFDEPDPEANITAVEPESEGFE